uniref:transposase n=1 Tax=Escherichia coli TaxID=562 RepID=UPI0015625C93
VINKSVFLALGINIEGQKELLGMWLAIQSASRKWTMPLKDWRMAMSRFIIEFGDRLDGHF